MPKTAVTLEEIYQPIDARLKGVPKEILGLLAAGNPLGNEVIQYFFSAMGKLLRPALTFLGAEVKGVDASLDKRLLALASSFEIFHAATLIHDDIIDSAFIRRNIPTVNVKWNSQVAVLVGDYLHDKAIGTIFTQSTNEIFALFLKTAGLVCDGEIHELSVKGNFNLSEQEYIDIVDKKTAVLLGCAVQSGAMLAGATQKEAEALYRYGQYFGIAFQIIDDCLDFTGEEQEFGKTLGADCLAGVLTLPVIRLLQISNEKKREEIIALFKNEENTERYPAILSLIREGGTIDYALEKAKSYCDKARQEISIFPDNAGRRSLDKLVDYVLERNR